MDLTSVATTTRPSTTTAGNAADALEPLAASDLETYLGSDLHDVDDAKPSAHSGHRTASPVHLVPHAHQHPKKKVGGRGGGSAQGGAQGGGAPGRMSPGHAAPAAPAGFSGKKRCFSIVLEDKVKRYKETPC
ncbi:uncharacterized protein LOC117648431 [Thrips palmi]|uniref:Uncharacterized protein LOC117648431 n=1 Tax=Thrips palmi TaxID=161013 RepID=A0A6P8Z8Y7_THRPL|nr:uncharacterized protein LOC117648431 [Thrips palmi]